MIKLAFDENFNDDVVRGVLRRKPDLDLVRVRDAGLAGAADPDVLAWAAGQGRSSTTQIVDWPASYHGQAGGFAFADGHSEVHKWRDSRTMPALTTDLVRQPSPNNQDIVWLWEHCSHDHD